TKNCLIYRLIGSIDYERGKGSDGRNRWEDGIPGYAPVFDQISFGLIFPTSRSYIGKIVPGTVKSCSWGIDMGIIFIPRVIGLPIVPVCIINGGTIGRTGPEQSALSRSFLSFGAGYPPPLTFCSRI